MPVILALSLRRWPGVPPGRDAVFRISLTAWGVTPWAVAV